MMAAPSGAAAASGQKPRSDTQFEDLGTQLIEGITAHGKRITRTWPVDSVGNDRPIVTVNEYWTSDQLGGMMVFSKSSDPRYGEQTMALKNINLAEPDPVLFQPPPGYQIVDQEGPFNVNIPRPAAKPASN